MEYSKEKKQSEQTKANINSENRVALIRGEGAAGREKCIKTVNCMETKILVVSMM